MTVLTRFPPSPSGDLHLGGARTALFNWLYARGQGGEMVLRIEDTDRERSSQRATDGILQSLEWLGLTWRGAPVYQSQRLARYAEVVQQLLDAGCAYRCFCGRERLQQVREQQQQRGEKPGYDRKCRDLSRAPRAGESYAVRFKTPLDGDIAFDDIVHGRVSVANRELDDLVIAREGGAPTYNLTAVADDADMQITHVIRGDDHINNTPRQIHIFNALGVAPPQFAHVPMILGQDGKRLSKRDGATGVLAYRDAGILPEALLNYLVRLGWSHAEREIFTLDEMIALFDISDINKSAAAFDADKLLWINQHHIKTAAPQHLAGALHAQFKRRGITPDDDAKLEQVCEAMRERAQTLEQMAEQAAFIYADFGEYDAAAAKKHLRAKAAPLLTSCRDELARLETWRADAISEAVQKVIKAHDVGLGKLAQPLRVAVSGRAATPSIDITLALVGQTRTLERIDRALAWIAKE